ncbi:MAG TPA: transglutaminaseTgpA domain-containing protein [Acidimicrobiales bacterium]|nr:transglutaminaseTgpA domain-containing protein [Acidimicrobiales bacterium]
MSLVGAVKAANRPGPAEHSILFRVAATLCVVVAIAACWSEGELNTTFTVASIILVIAGNVFSYWRREQPLPWLKLLLALAVVVSFFWFFVSITKRSTFGNLSTVEGPLAVLFTLIQVTHAFDVPSRRDLGFSMAGSATLMAAAAAQAVDSTLGLYVIVWAAIGLVGMMAMWSSMVGGARLRGRTVGLTAVAVLVLGGLIVALLPAPRASSTIVFPTSLAGDVELPSQGSLAGGSSGTQPLAPGSSAGPTRVGGFLGFAGPLDTAIRGSLGNQVVFRVRADRPTFWLAETFNAWDGQSWSQTPLRKNGPLFQSVGQGPPFQIPLAQGVDPRATVPDIQTFYVAVTGANLILHAAEPTEVWFPASSLYLAPDDTMRAGTSLGSGSVYTVQSNVATPSPAELRSTTSGGLFNAEYSAYTQIPLHRYARVAALARRITANQPNDYDKVVALEAWIGEHTKYTTNIPALKRGQDTVNDFLFGTRRGYCEQISTSLAVMLRSLGIPAREAVGYVPGPYNPLTDLYDVQARDAHAWVQVWFAKYGWQSFDPTAFVPTANPTPASALAHDAWDALRKLPLVPIAVILGLLLAASVLVHAWRRQPKTWAAAMTRQLERASRSAGLALDPTEPLSALAFRLDTHLAGRGPPGPSALDLALAAERAAYGVAEPDATTKRYLSKQARGLRRRARQSRAGRSVRSAGGRAPPRSSPAQP